MQTVAVVTGTRAEYGLLRGVLCELAAGGRLQTRLLVTGSHLSAAHGATVSEIEADGFEIAARLDILGAEAPDGRAGTAVRTALALRLFTDWLAAHRPDAVLLLGDRYEIFAAGQAAALLGIPLAHISGGDVTAGADDDWFRHCLSKMAKLHFPSCEAYRRRLIRMGEQPAMVHNVGGLGDENIRKLPLVSAGKAAESLGLVLEKPYALITLHPETAGNTGPKALAEALFAGLDAHPGLFCLFTGSNADAGGAEIDKAVAAYCKGRPNAARFASLGVVRYLSLMKEAAVVVGNSSSGVVETPSLGVPAVDIGARQQGRETGQNVLHCAADGPAVAAAIGTALTAEFNERARKTVSPYNGGNTALRIATLLADALDEGLLSGPKIFYDGEDAP